MDNTLKATETMTGGTLQNPRTEWATTMHCNLKPYAFPNGVEVPRLMPFQEFPWNGDGYLAAEVLRLKAAHGLECAIETGTCLGSTALWLSDHFNGVWTFEISAPFLAIAHARFGDTENIESLLCDSVDGLRNTLVDFNAPFLLWADAHWQDHCPLLDELTAIAKTGVKPCIVIHDFQVPGTDFGFDKMPDGRPFDMQLICNHLNDIYGQDKWTYNYPTNVEGARRGWISIEPVHP